MCIWGTTEPVHVTIQADLSHTGELRHDWKEIDACIAPIVRGLEHAGVLMRSSCCGHGCGDGEIILLDGRTIIIKGGGGESKSLHINCDKAKLERVR